MVTERQKQQAAQKEATSYIRVCVWDCVLPCVCGIVAKSEPVNWDVLGGGPPRNSDCVGKRNCPSGFSKKKKRTWKRFISKRQLVTSSIIEKRIRLETRVHLEFGDPVNAGECDHKTEQFQQQQ
uniref:(northern house mosquito) hypothetical protein n=1 Tax=Culex pipiens TaxID=7175 RepID=A0A8D7ZSN7_CULPI